MFNEKFKIFVSLTYLKNESIDIRNNTEYQLVTKGLAQMSIPFFFSYFFN